MNRKQRRAQGMQRAPHTYSASPFTQHLFREAVRHHQAGQLGEANRLYRQVLATVPRHAESLHLLGVLACQAGRPDAGAGLIRQAIAIDGKSASYHFNLGNALRDLGQPGEAIPCYRKALELKPDFVDAHNNLGNALKDSSRLREAAACYRRAVGLKPDYALALSNLAGALQELGQWNEAVDCCRRALRLKPDYVEALVIMGVSLKELGQLDEAIDCFRKALYFKRDNAEALNNLAAALMDQGRWDEAVGCLRSALALRPSYLQAISNMGLALQGQRRLDEAIDFFRKVTELTPDAAEAHTTLGVAFWEEGRLNEAIAAYEKALSIDPECAGAHFNLGHALLLQGDFRRGWDEYEWRWQITSARYERKRDFLQPSWSGETLDGKTILLWAEQGFGDTIQFARYAGLVAEAGARVVVEVPRPLARLIASVPGVAAVVARQEALPPFDVHLPMMSIPRVVGTTLATIPARVPYVHAEAAAVENWHRRLLEMSGPPARPKVGLVWAGDAQSHDPYANAIDKRRSVALETFEPLLQVPGVAFVSLQKGPAAGQLVALPKELRPIDLTAEIDDFADTAALIANLDLVITVDTSVAHLAGAMAKSVWILSRFDGDWRWLRDREDSPWYPTARLFRQSRPGEWQSVVDKLTAELRRFAKGCLWSARG